MSVSWSLCRSQKRCYFFRLYIWLLHNEARFVSYRKNARTPNNTITRVTNSNKYSIQTRTYTPTYRAHIWKKRMWKIMTISIYTWYSARCTTHGRYAHILKFVDDKKKYVLVLINLLMVSIVCAHLSAASVKLPMFSYDNYDTDVFKIAHIAGQNKIDTFFLHQKRRGVFFRPC